MAKKAKGKKRTKIERKRTAKKTSLKKWSAPKVKKWPPQKGDALLVGTTKSARRRLADTDE
jgi:hypothetical protein